MKKVFEKPKMLTDVPFHYCPGCSHGIVHRMVASAIDKLNAEKVIGVAPVGCAVFAYDYFNCDMQEAAHGRAPAVATGIKRTNPDAILLIKATETWQVSVWRKLFMLQQEVKILP